MSSIKPSRAVSTVALRTIERLPCAWIVRTYVTMCSLKRSAQPMHTVPTGVRCVLTHDAFLLDHLRINVEKRCLGFGRIGHEALAEPCGAAGHLGDGGGDAAARAAFGRHDDVPPLCGDDAETLGRQRYALVEIRHDPQPKSQPRMLTTTQA